MGKDLGPFRGETGGSDRISHLEGAPMEPQAAEASPLVTFSPPRDSLDIANQSTETQEAYSPLQSTRVRASDARPDCFIGCLPPSILRSREGWEYSLNVFLLDLLPCPQQL